MKKIYRIGSGKIIGKIFGDTIRDYIENVEISELHPDVQKITEKMIPGEERIICGITIKRVK